MNKQEAREIMILLLSRLLTYAQEEEKNNAHGYSKCIERISK